MPTRPRYASRWERALPGGPRLASSVRRPTRTASSCCPGGGRPAEPLASRRTRSGSDGWSPPPSKIADSASAGASVAAIFTTSTPPALMTGGVAGRGDRNVRRDLLGQRHPAADVPFRSCQSAGSARSSAASRLPLFENATVMYRPPQAGQGKRHHRDERRQIESRAPARGERFRFGHPIRALRSILTCPPELPSLPGAGFDSQLKREPRTAPRTHAADSRGLVRDDVCRVDRAGWAAARIRAVGRVGRPHVGVHRSAV